MGAGSKWVGRSLLGKPVAGVWQATMNVSIDCHRAAIGNWYFTSLTMSYRERQPLTPIRIKTVLGLILSSYGIYIGILLILRSGDVHPNPGPVFEDKALTISHANVESLYLLSDTDYPRRKIDEIESILINDLKSDIVCISETWLKPLVLDEKVDIAGFKFRRKDRLEYRSGGAGMYISDYLPNRRADEYEKEEI